MLSEFSNVHPLSSNETSVHEEDEEEEGDMTRRFEKHGIHYPQLFAELAYLSDPTKECHAADHKEDLSKHDVLLRIFPVHATPQLVEVFHGTSVSIAGDVESGVNVVTKQLEIVLGRPETILGICSVHKSPLIATSLLVIAGREQWKPFGYGRCGKGSHG